MARENELIALAQGGDLEAFSQLVSLHQSRVRVFLGRFIFSKEAVDDVAQETFLAASRGFSTWPSTWASTGPWTSCPAQGLKSIRT